MRTRSRQRPSGNCPKCGVFREILHRDHIVPKWNGGLNEPSNWQLLCANCHEDKTRTEARSEAMRQRMSRLHIGRPKSTETRARLAELQRGKKLSAETKAKIGAAGRGRKWQMSAIGKEHCRQAALLRESVKRNRQLKETA